MLNAQKAIKISYTVQRCTVLSLSEMPCSCLFKDPTPEYPVRSDWSAYTPEPAQLCLPVGTVVFSAFSLFISTMIKGIHYANVLIPGDMARKLHHNIFRLYLKIQYISRYF